MLPKFQRFTESSIVVVMIAQEESRRLGHSFCGTEQLFLGLIREKNGVASKVLKEFGITIDAAREATQDIVGFGSAKEAEREISFTPRARHTIELAWAEATKLDNEVVDTEHILLALTSQDTGVATTVMERLEIPVQGIRKRIMELRNKQK